MFCPRLATLAVALIVTSLTLVSAGCGKVESEPPRVVETPAEQREEKKIVIQLKQPESADSIASAPRVNPMSATRVDGAPGREAAPDSAPQVVRSGASKKGDEQGTDLGKEREAFRTKLRKKGPAPQEYEKEPVPRGASLVRFPSGSLTLKGIVSNDPADGKKRPAVVFLHGGFAYGNSDWEYAKPFVDAGFVLLMPMLRAENGNPGNFECFYGEIDDAIAAGKYVASLPYVDARNVFVIGHSTGAIESCLVAMLPSPYKAAGSLDGWVDMETWNQAFGEDTVPYEPADRDEVRLRNPMEFVGSLRIPLKLYAAVNGNAERNQAMARKARRLGKECEVVVVPGNHMSMQQFAIPLAAEWFKSLTSN